MTVPCRFCLYGDAWMPCLCRKFCCIGCGYVDVHAIEPIYSTGFTPPEVPHFKETK